MQGYRKTLKFLVPRNKDALGNFSLENRDVVPIYINPSGISIRERKLIQKQQTKGGFVVQYWGEELPSMSVNGTTGSAGIEGIHILRDVYRSEQVIMRRQLMEKMSNQTDAMVGTLTGLAEIGEKATSFWGGLTQGAEYSGMIEYLGAEWFQGSKSVVDAWVNSFTGATEAAVSRTVLHPSLGAYAVSIDVYFQGERFRGYFNNFNYNERAASPGLFDYSFEFTITKKMGKRSNFMPWHRSPTDLGGQPIPAAIPAGKETDGIDSGLSYPPTYDTAPIFQPNSDDLVTEGAFAGESISDAEEVEVGIDRNSNLVNGD